MLSFIVLPIVIVVFLIGLAFYLYPGKRSRPTTVPGLDPSNIETGNLSDITSAGSYHEFLVNLHKTFGPVASFWFGSEYVVSTSDPQTFRTQMRFFDKPKCLFAMFEPLLGSGSVQFLNGEAAKDIRRKTDPYFSQSNCARLLPKLIEIADDLKADWQSMDDPGRRLPLHQYMYGLAFKGIIMTVFGDEMQDDDTCLQFMHDYDMCFHEMESRVDGITPDRDSVQERNFQKALQSMRSIVNEIMNRRKDETYPERYLVDELIDASACDEQALDNVVTYVVAGQHTTATMMVWLLYYLASNPDCYTKTVEELYRVIGPKDKEMQPEHYNELKYCRQVVDETLRCSVMAPFGARMTESDTTINGHAIPKDTMLVQAYGVVLTNPDFWPEPCKFNPDNFAESPDHKIDPLTCPFFGFAGKRKCPGYKLSYFEAFAILSVILRNFRIKLANPDQPVQPRYGIVTQPDEEIYILVDKI